MLNIPVIRWGKPYESLEVDEVLHFMTGEPIAKVGQANGGLLQRDMHKAQNARNVLRDIPCSELIERIKKAAKKYLNRRKYVDARLMPEAAAAPSSESE